MNDTPQTDEAIVLDEIEQGCVPAWFARTLERENAQLRAALAFIVKHGGMTHETECGEIQCTGFWCAEQARAALNQSTP